MKIRNNSRSRLKFDELDITSLLDILVILIVFLLKSFNDSDLSIDLVNELSLPYSMSRVGAEDGLIVQVNKKYNVFINNELLGNLKDDGTLSQLKENLLKYYKDRKENSKSAGGELVNLVFDQDLQYKEINEIMKVSAASGFGKYKLIIQGVE